MSITKQSTPSLLVPVYNPFYIVCTSNNSAQANFKFIFDVYTGSTATTYVSRYKLLARPIIGNCIFSPARTLESFVSYDLYPSTLGGINSVNIILKTTVQIGEEWGSLSSGTTIYSGLTQTTGYTFNGVQQYTQLPSWDYTVYTLSGSTNKFLTNQPAQTYIKNTTDRGTISFLNFGVSSGVTAQYPKYIQVLVSRTSGGTGTYILGNTAWSAGTQPNNMINHFGVGIWNLNNTPASLFYSGTTPVINIDTDSQYTITALNGQLSAISETKTYIVDSKVSKSPTVRFMWVNRMGCIDYFNSNLVSKRTITSTKNTFKKVLDYNYTVGQRGTTVLDINAQEKRTAETDWVTNAESQWLEELFTSHEVYELQSDGSYLPIIIENNSVEILKSINDKMLQYTFQYTLTYPTDTQRN